MAQRRHKSVRTVKVRRRVVTYRTVTRQVVQCEPCYVRFGEAVREARLAKGWTQQELARKLKMSVPSISNIETGSRRVLLGDVFEFAKALGVEVRKLITSAIGK